MPETTFDPGAEFDRQVRTLVAKGYPAATGLPEDGFRRLVEPLRDMAVARAGALPTPTPARVPFALVITKDLAPTERLVPLTHLAGSTRPGVIDRNYPAGDLTRFELSGELALPGASVYLVLDVDRGAATLNVPPQDALHTITAQGRSPLTIDEGIALITQFPESLARNNCFSLPGSRCGARRVPALWISAGAPKLGWCWAGNPHTWLGSASCAARAPC